MDTTAVGRVALMSIHPAYAERILDGSKQVEFRKRPVADDVTHVLVYATAPVSAVVGAFTVGGQHTTSPGELWKRFKEVAGIGRRALMEYFGDREVGTGIAVGDVLYPASPLSLVDDLGVARPPQSYQYVCPDTARRVLSSMSPSK